MITEEIEPFYAVVVELANLGVDATVHHAGGNIQNVRVVDPEIGGRTLDFGMEPGDVVGYDVTIDGEYSSSGELDISSDAPARVIAFKILGLIGSLRFAAFQATGRDVADIGAEVDAPDMAGRPGRIYLDAYWIARAGTWGWRTTVGNCEYASQVLAIVEKDLYYFQIEDDAR